MNSTLVLTALLFLVTCPWTGTGTGRLRRWRGQVTHRADTRQSKIGPDIDLVVVLELLEVATAAGAPIPRALEVVGDAVGGADGKALRTAGAGLVLGASWQAAWGGVEKPTRLRPVAHALRGAWENGAAPGRALRAAGEAMRRDSDRRTRTAAARLGVQLVLPVGLCLLPAFVLIGLVPIFASLGLDLLRG